MTGPGGIRPDLSVIVPAVNDIEILQECLAALLLNTTTARLEILVIERGKDKVRRGVAGRIPDVTVYPVSDQTTIPQMRALGIQAATADAIAIIEDHVLVPTNWARQLLDALASGADVVGGSVRNAATTTVVDWAAFLCEYSHLLAPRPGRNVDNLTGNNVVYRRTTIERYIHHLAEGHWEDALHAAMRRDGIALVCRPDIVVGHKMHYRMTEYVTQRFLYSRARAGTIRTTLPAFRRAWLTVGAFALPPLLFGRVVFRVLTAGRHYRELVQSLPLLVVFVSAWAAGEVVGYAVGPGDALARVR